MQVSLPSLAGLCIFQLGRWSTPRDPSNRTTNIIVSRRPTVKTSLSRRSGHRASSSYQVVTHVLCHCAPLIHSDRKDLETRSIEPKQSERASICHIGHRPSVSMSELPRSLLQVLAGFFFRFFELLDDVLAPGFISLLAKLSLSHLSCLSAFRRHCLVWKFYLCRPPKLPCHFY